MVRWWAVRAFLLGVCHIFFTFFTLVHHVPGRWVFLLFFFGNQGCLSYALDLSTLALHMQGGLACLVASGRLHDIHTYIL
jgi:hypothetical protein